MNFWKKIFRFFSFGKFIQKIFCRKRTTTNTKRKNFFINKKNDRNRTFVNKKKKFSQVPLDFHLISFRPVFFEKKNLVWIFPWEVYIKQIFFFFYSYKINCGLKHFYSLIFKTKHYLAASIYSEASPTVYLKISH